MCANDRCFKYRALSPFFRAGKVLPVQRGGGMHQPGMQAAELALQRGEWVHIFPEGTRTSNPQQLGPVRKGVGRLVACSEVPPVVLPFVHAGMETVMPRGSVLPAVGKKVRPAGGREGNTCEDRVCDRSRVTLACLRDVGMQAGSSPPPK